MVITLTQEDIANGIRKNSHACPFALAFRRAFPEADDIDVWLYDVTVRHGATVTRYTWDDADFSLILDGYDAGHKFLSPARFTFTEIDLHILGR